MYPVDLFGVVRRLQRTDGSSSIQHPAARSSGSTSRGLMPARMRPFSFSTCPFDWGCEIEPDAVDAAETRNGTLGEVGAVVGDDAVWVAVLVDDVAEETDRSLAVQYLDRLCFDPLGELVHRHQKVG